MRFTYVQVINCVENKEADLGMITLKIKFRQRTRQGPTGNEINMNVYETYHENMYGLYRRKSSVRSLQLRYANKPKLP